MTLSLKLEKLYILLLTFYNLRPGCHSYDPEASITGLYTGPYFDPLAPRNLTAHLNDRAVLPCTVRQLGDKSVSWVRMRDADILTVDRYTFVSDERFEAHYSPPLETWNLIIKYVQERDAGQYECQVSTEPKMSQLFNLRVVVPRVSMLPPGDRYVKAGSKVRIDCQITDVVQQPDYIFWYHDGIRVLENQDVNLGVLVKKTGDESMMSTLTISRVRREESGNYTCMPSNLHSSSVLLHVLNEEHPEAMKDGRNASCKMEQPIYLFILFVLCTIVGYLFNDCGLPDKNIGQRKSITVKRGFQLANYVTEGKQRQTAIERKKSEDNYAVDRDPKKGKKSTGISKDLTVLAKKFEIIAEIAQKFCRNFPFEVKEFMKREVDVSKIVGDNNASISLTANQIKIDILLQLLSESSGITHNIVTDEVTDNVFDAANKDKTFAPTANKDKTFAPTANEILTQTSVQNEASSDFQKLMFTSHCLELLADNEVLQDSTPKLQNPRAAASPNTIYKPLADDNNRFSHAQNVMKRVNNAVTNSLTSSR